MNHTFIYISIIENAKLQSRKKISKSHVDYVYYENHHILPKCLGGKNDDENLVLLSPKEHFICHKLLTRIYPNNRKIACAYHKMVYGNSNKYTKTARDYAYARELVSLIPMSNETLEKFHLRIPWNKDKKGLQSHSEISKKNLSLHNKGENNAMFGKTGNKCPSYGLKRSKETKELLKIAKQGKNNPNAGTYQINAPDGKYFEVRGATTFIKEHPEYKINRHFIYSAANSKGLYKKWLIKKLN